VQVCGAILGERGLPVGEVHIDDGRSAWNPRVHRPGWEALMARLESGAAGGVIVFDLERFTRQPEAEGGRLIAAAERGLIVLDSDAEFDLLQPQARSRSATLWLQRPITPTGSTTAPREASGSRP
jgi:site-specific DNA recombinase